MREICDSPELETNGVWMSTARAFCGQCHTCTLHHGILHIIEHVSGCHLLIVVISSYKEVGTVNLLSFSKTLPLLIYKNAYHTHSPCCIPLQLFLVLQWT